MGATRDVAMTEIPMRGISINALSSGVNAFTLVPSDSGVIFVNKETATSTTTYTLPAVALGKGKIFWFFNAQTTRAIAVAAPTAILVGLDSATGTTATSDAVTGSAAFVVGDGTNYYLFVLKGSWTVA